MSVPSGSKNQQKAANDIFNKFLSNAQMSWEDVSEFTIYWVLEEFAKFLFNYASSKVKNENNTLSSSTADNYLSQVFNVIMLKICCTNTSDS
ncbi:hypothetical protein THRCLA_10407 [Thraustotheca clavata]|uniref:Uncharacterized protein n=1 Tax=Thraustotheca clavata TaxID=74557 RepID=A0A1V9YRD6_9STRA|nr:hypothetical protein THRCLA_10407 [Thraustotheca clavata]